MRVKKAACVLWTCAASGVASAEEGTPTFGEIEVDVTAPLPISRPLHQRGLQQEALSFTRYTTSDTATLLRDIPGVSTYHAGGLSSLPAIHGLADDRVRTQIDEMDIISACPNHMNPPLSYIDPTDVQSVQVYTGVTPVSVGGDSIGGTIKVSSLRPEFSPETLTKGQLGAFYRSNGDAFGAHARATLTNDQLSLTYGISTTQSNNYRAGADFKAAGLAAVDRGWLSGDEVGASAYEATNQSLDVAVREGADLWTAKLGVQHIPYEGFPNQRMDLTDNNNTQAQLAYRGQLPWGRIEARTSWQDTRHQMQFGEDKQFLYGTPATIPGMPMDTKARALGLSIKADVHVSERDTARIGGEYVRQRLDDWWKPSGGGMAPNTFQNINDGQRDRYALFGEWEAQFNTQWKGLLGLRHETVVMDTGTVHGYDQTNGMGAMVNQQLADSTAFNERDRSKTDRNWDMTGSLYYTPDQEQTYGLGVAQKTRSPNLYERYTWSTWAMAAVMNNFVGDGNGYVGDPDLQPEVAHTFNVHADWHAPDRRWSFEVTPYYTHVEDYIDAIRCSHGACMPANATTTNQFVVLQYANQSAKLYGVDITSQVQSEKTAYGQWGLHGQLSYTHGENTDTHDDLYNIMPLNAKLTLTNTDNAWRHAIDWVLVQGKDAASDVRNEVKTAGYGLLHFRGGYVWKTARLDWGVENVLDKRYDLPTGGAYVGQGKTMGINAIPWGIAVPGMGRTFYTAVNFTF